MKNRLQEFITREGLTAAKLAEIAGVQPSAISHILSGRNYPRFDFLYNLLKAYPKMNPRWLLLGEGDIYYTQAKHKEVAMEITTSPEEYEPRPQGELFSDRNNSRSKFTAISEDNPCSKKKAIDKVIVFYDDGTFSLYENK